MLSLPKGMNEHYGRNVDKMPAILTAGEVPASIAGIMKARLEQGEEFPDLWNNWYDTSDLAVYPKGNNKDVYVFSTVDSKGKITQNGRRALELIRADNLASNYGAKVEQLRDLGRKGLVKVSRSNIKTDTYLTKDKALSEQVWRILARHPDEVAKEFAEDKDLLREYISEVAKRTGNTKNMALYVGDSLKDQTTLKAWYVNWLVNRSDASGRSYLVNDSGRLLGIAPEAQGAPGNEGKIRTYTPDQVRGALKDLGFPGLTKTLIDKLGEEK